MPAYIYRITNQIDQKFYIGQTRRTVAARFAAHTSAANFPNRGCPILSCAMRKHGIKHFVVDVLECVIDAKDLNERERFWISTLHPQYNVTLGGYGSGGVAPSAETRAKISAANSGRIHSVETRAKMSAAKMGRRRSPLTIEARLKRSVALKGRKLTPEHRAKLSSAKMGRKLSLEHRAKLSAAKMGRKRTYPTTSFWGSYTHAPG